MKRQLMAVLLSLCAGLSFAAVDVNKASASDLDSIKGIGPSTSAKIIEQRKSAPFRNWSDLMGRVHGIGDKRATKLSRQGLTVNGEAYKPAAAAPAKPKA